MARPEQEIGAAKIPYNPFPDEIYLLSPRSIKFHFLGHPAFSLVTAARHRGQQKLRDVVTEKTRRRRNYLKALKKTERHKTGFVTIKLLSQDTCQ
jgi:hypothetical protein